MGTMAVACGDGSSNIAFLHSRAKREARTLSGRGVCDHALPCTPGIGLGLLLASTCRNFRMVRIGCNDLSILPKLRVKYKLP